MRERIRVAVIGEAGLARAEVVGAAVDTFERVRGAVRAHESHARVLSSHFSLVLPPRTAGIAQWVNHVTAVADHLRHPP